MDASAQTFTIVEMDSQTLSECAQCERTRTVSAELGPLDGPPADPGLLGQLILSEAQSQAPFPEGGSAGHRRQPSADIYARQLARAEFPATEPGADFLAFYPMGGGARIKAARLAAKLSQRKLAQALDVAESTLRSWETDEHQAPMNMLAAIAKATGVRGDFLLGQRDDIVFIDREAQVDEISERSREEMRRPPDNPRPPDPARAPRRKSRPARPPS
jgi:transcriptional regulator with XRE-family HTH domain